MAQSFFEMGIDAQRPAAKKRPWMDHKVMELVTVDTLTRVIEECITSGRYGLDVETTGLDKRVFNGRTHDQIVGVCLSPDGVRGYYLPLRHKKGEEHNLPISRTEQELRRLVASPSVAVFHNAKFDQEFLQWAGGEPIGTWDDVKKWEDTIILAWLRNTRENQKGLKYLSKQELGFEMIELEELFPPDHTGPLNFSLLDPSDESTILYGCSDAICTYCLYDVLRPQVAPKEDITKGQGQIYLLEKMTVPATRWMERCRLFIDQAKVKELMQLGQQEYFDCLAEIYDFSNQALGRNTEPGWFQILRKKIDISNVDFNITEQIADAKLEAKREMLDSLDVKGHFIQVERAIAGERRLFPEKYDILSRPQLGPLFEELEIPDLHRTDKSKQVQTTQSEIDRLNEKYGVKYPFLPKIKRMGELQKALGTYLISLRNDVGPDGTLTVNYQQLGTDTGRYTTPGSKDPSVDGGTKFPLHGTPAIYDKKRPQCLLRIREAIKTRSGKIMVSIDFSGVELRIITNLSHEPKWLTEFFRCSSCALEFDRGDGVSTPAAPPTFCPRCGDDKIGDLHTLTGISFFGEDKVGTKEWKLLRTQAKISNFTLAYGGGPRALTAATGCSDTEAGLHHRAFLNSYRVLKHWWDEIKAFGVKHGYVQTALGRRYPLPDIQLPTSHKECPDPRQRELNKQFKSKAERNATNGPVQGCLHSSVRIMTSEGNRTIGEMWELQKQGVTTFQVWTGKSWERARALASGMKDLVVTEFDSGQTIKTSPDHLFRVYQNGGFEWVAQHDLTHNSWVATNAKPAVWSTQQDYEYKSHHYMWDGVEYQHRHFSWNRKVFEINGNAGVLWEFLGLLYGDGSIREDFLILHVGEAPSHIPTRTTAQQFSQDLADRLNRDLGVGAIVRERPRSKGDSRRATWTVEIHNKSFREFCRKILGVEDQTTYDKRFPHALWAESFENQAAFLRGYFSADGCINNQGSIDVRSINPGLLQDTHQLLRNLGIRSALRLNSMRTSVKDRFGFRQHIGFLSEHKQNRLADLKLNPYTNQWHLCPPELVARVGETVRHSTVYKSLTPGEKSAVSRLMLGSGSKSQCLSYLNRLPESEVPQSLLDALVYDYERPVHFDVMSTQVEMYDLEVFDEDHAFVADGYIVHNSSADITKLFMALVYREVKKRDWFDKVYLIITIHDELVFEIDKDIAAEAVELFQDIACRNKTVLGLKWPVPLTTDCEVGYDWTVPYNTNVFKNRRVRRDGVELNEKGKPTGKVWPDDLVRVFGTQYGFPMEEPQGTPGDDSETAQAPLEGSEPGRAYTEPETPQVHSEAPSVPSIPPTKFEKGEVHEYRLHKKLGSGLAHVLAEVLVECRGRGFNPLRVLSPTGENVLWEESILVNPIEFDIIARSKGI